MSGRFSGARGRLRKGPFSFFFFFFFFSPFDVILSIYLFIHFFVLDGLEMGSDRGKNRGGDWVWDSFGVVAFLSFILRSFCLILCCTSLSVVVGCADISRFYV
ncbi:hypothetical protein L209DRAFT_32749 [Thermothelomyces heterothallicus CBS 203.75]